MSAAATTASTINNLDLNPLDQNGLPPAIRGRPSQALLNARARQESRLQQQLNETITSEFYNGVPPNYDKQADIAQSYQDEADASRRFNHRYPENSTVNGDLAEFFTVPEASSAAQVPEDSVSPLAAATANMDLTHRGVDDMEVDQAPIDDYLEPNGDNDNPIEPFGDYRAQDGDYPENTSQDPNEAADVEDHKHDILEEHVPAASPIRPNVKRGTASSAPVSPVQASSAPKAVPSAQSVVNRFSALAASVGQPSSAPPVVRQSSAPASALGVMPRAVAKKGYAVVPLDNKPLPIVLAAEAHDPQALENRLTEIRKNYNISTTVNDLRMEESNMLFRKQRIAKLQRQLDFEMKHYQRQQALEPIRAEALRIRQLQESNAKTWNDARKFTEQVDQDDRVVRVGGRRFNTAEARFIKADSDSDDEVVQRGRNKKRRRPRALPDDDDDDRENVPAVRLRAGIRGKGLRDANDEAADAKRARRRAIPLLDE